MLLSAVSVLVVAQSSSEIPEELMNNPVFWVNCVLFFALMCLKVSLKEYIPHHTWKMVSVGYNKYSHTFGNRVFPCLQYSFILRRNDAITKVTIKVPTVGKQLVLKRY